MNVLALFCDRSRIVANRHNNRVGINIKHIAVLCTNLNLAVGNFAKSGFKVYGDVVCLKEVTEEACVCKADALCCDKVVLHFNNCGLLALKVKVVCDFTARKTAADNGHVLANLCVAKEVVNGFDGSVSTLNGDSLCLCTGCDDDFVSIERLYIGYFCVHINCDWVFCKLTDVPRNESSVLFLEGGSGSGNKYATELVALFIECYAVTSLCAKDSCFHTADTAADNCNLLQLFSRRY